MKEIKNVYALVYVNIRYRKEEAIIFHVLESDYITAVMKHRKEGYPQLGDDWKLRSINCIAEDVNY